MITVLQSIKTPIVWGSSYMLLWGFIVWFLAGDVCSDRGGAVLNTLYCSIGDGDPRTRRATIMDIQYGGKTVQVKDVHYLLAKDRDKVGIGLFFDGYNEREKSTFGQIGYLMLDEALGEYAVEMQVGFIEFHSRDSKYFSQASPLRGLPAHFDEYSARTTR